ncbi:MAG: hypothetical protein ACOCX1_02160 [Fimbriimonadaceae bacterium]
MTPLVVLGSAFALFLTFIFVRSLVTGEWKLDYRVLKAIRGKRFLPALISALFVLVAVLFVGTVLYVYGGPILQFSWLTLLATTPEEAAEAPQNLALSGVRIPFFGLIFIALLALNVPRLAMNEEYMFRKGVRGIGPHAWASLKFGLAHCLIGVPIAFGLALGIAGAWFSYQYSKGGLRRSGAYHILHNWLILLLLALVLLQGAL